MSLDINPTGVAAVHQGVYELWAASGLVWEFQKFWTESERTRFPSLHDQEAGPATPMPYCVFSLTQSNVRSRMTGPTKDYRYQQLDIPLEFIVQAKATTSSDSAKTVCIYLVERMKQIFGGHPDAVPRDIQVPSGSVLQVQYKNDYGIRTGDDNYSWILRYEILFDSRIKDR